MDITTLALLGNYGCEVIPTIEMIEDIYMKDRRKRFSIRKGLLRIKFNRQYYELIISKKEKDKLMKFITKKFKCKPLLLEY